MPQLPSLEMWRKATVLRVAINGNRIKDTASSMAWLLTESDSTTQLISNAILMGQTSVSFESMSSIMQEKTHKKRSYGSLRTPPIPALPGFPRNPLHPILQYHPRVSSSYYEARIFFFPDARVHWLIDHGSPVSCGF